MELNETIKTLIRIGATRPDIFGAITLIGPPRSGKTTLLKKFAEEEGHIPLLINPAICAPEDVGGIPVLNREEGIARYSQPLVIPPHLMSEQKVTIIVDELDKAELANQVPLLTLLAERRIREFHLPEQWRVVVAMNEPKMTMEEALVERLLFIPYAPGLDIVKPTLKYMRSLPLAFYKPEDVAFPARKITRGALHYADSWAQHRDVWHDEDTRIMLLRGLFPAAGAAALMAEIGELEVVFDPVDMFTNAPIQDIAPALVAIICAAAESEEKYAEMMKAWEKRIEADKTGEFQILLEKFAQKDDERALKAQAAVAANASPEQIAAGQAALDEILAGVPSLKAKSDAEKEKRAAKAAKAAEAASKSGKRAKK